VVTNLESLLLRLAEKSSHVHITKKGFSTQKCRDRVLLRIIGFDLPQR